MQDASSTILHVNQEENVMLPHERLPYSAIEGRPPLHFEDVRNRDRIAGVCSEAVDGFRRECHQAAGSDNLSGFSDRIGF